MKILNVLMIIAVVLILAGTIAFSLSNNNEPAVNNGSKITTIYSRDDSILSVDNEEKIIYVLEGTVQTDIPSNVGATDYSVQTYRVTQSEGLDKQKDEIYEFDRLYVTAENGTDKTYYIFRYIDELPQ